MQGEAQPFLEEAPLLHVAAQADAALAAARVQLPTLLPPPTGCICHRRGHARPGLREDVVPSGRAVQTQPQLQLH